jgi:hypothetical protein
MKPIKLAILTFIALAGIVVPTPAQVVVFNSFGPGNTYNSGIAWAVSGASSSGGYRGQAEFFTPGISGYLSSILLATHRVSGSRLSDFYIAQDNGSGTPGAILESFTNIQNANGLLTLNSTVQPLLQAGTEYWLCDEPTADNSYNGWYQNNQGYAPGFAYERSEWGWEAVPADYSPNSGVFQVSVTPVPEPSVTGLATLCGCLLFLRLKKPVVVE